MICAGDRASESAEQPGSDKRAEPRSSTRSEPVADPGALSREAADCPEALFARMARLDEELRISDERLRVFIEHAPAAVAMLDRELRYVLVSRRWLVDYGVGDIDLTGRSHFEVFPETPARFREVVERCLTGAVEKCDEDRFVRADGSVEWVRWQIFPWKDRAGEVGGLLLFTEVITERKEVERALRESYEEAKAAKAEAEAARTEAEAANRMKDEFLALLGHELRNPLAPILTALQLMKLRDTDGSTRERTIIERQVKHLVSLVDDLLDVSRITRGKIELKKNPLEIAQVITQAIEMASPLLEQRSQNLRVAVPRRGLLVEADEGRMAQVVSNLLTNAAKFTEPGGKIAISAEAENEQIVIRVRDTGTGIAPQMLQYIFNMFVQGDRTLDRAQGGLGIGLTIVRSLVELHGGKVTAHSEGLGKGAEFVVRLPALPQQLLDLAVHSTPVPTPAARPRVHGKRVLVVDDNTDAAETLADILHDLGHITSVAHDGPTALEKAAAFKPQIALLDIGLPVMDGYELARRLREQPELRRLRLFAITGYGQESDRERSRAAGFHEHLVKPVDLARLRALIEQSPRSPS